MRIRNLVQAQTRRTHRGFSGYLAVLLAAVLLGGAPVASAQEDDPQGADDQTKEQNETQVDSNESEEAEEPTEDEGVHFGGALRFNAYYKSWEGQKANRDKLGDMDMDTFRLNLDGSVKGVDISAEYRFYSGYNMLHHGYFGFNLAGGSQVQLGVQQVPFGILPYASHNWFFDIGYYVGLEDDYDMGVKYLPNDIGNLKITLAFYKNDEGNYTGDSIDSARYSYDVVHTDAAELGYAGVVGPRANEETNQLNARLAYMLGAGTDNTTEIGLSGEYGGVYNSITGDTGDHWAAAVHLNGTYGRFNVMLEGVGYEYKLDNPPGVDDRFVVMGAYDAPYKVASKGKILIANVAYKVPVDLGPISSINFYNDFSVLQKDEADWEDSYENVLGALFAGGPFYIYVDLAMGKNHPWIGADYGRALADGVPDASWETRFNVNFGYYF